MGLASKIVKGASRKALEGYKEILCATLSDNRITPEETWQMASWEILELNGGFYGKNMKGNNSIHEGTVSYIIKVYIDCSPSDYCNFLTFLKCCSVASFFWHPWMRVRR